MEYFAPGLYLVLTPDLVIAAVDHRSQALQCFPRQPGSHEMTIQKYDVRRPTEEGGAFNETGEIS